MTSYLCRAVLAAGLLQGCVFAQAGGARPEAPYHWNNVQIVGGGFVSGVLFHPAQRDLIYARTDIGGPYRWDAGARRWIPLTDWIGMANWNLRGVESIGLDPSDPNRLYIAAGTYIQSWADNGAILRSSDQGRTFEQTPMPFKMGGNEDGRFAGERLAVDPNNGGILYFGSRADGLWKSTDYAVTWNKVAQFPVTGPINGIGIVFVQFDARTKMGNGSANIYVGVSASSNGVYRSTDGGATWLAVPGQPSGFLPNHGVLAADGSLYVTYGNQPGPNNMTNGAFFKYDTNTGAWTDMTPMTPGKGNPYQFGYGGVALDPEMPGRVLVSTMDRWNPGDDIFSSSDGAAHWTPMSPKSARDDSASPWLNFGARAPSFGWWIGSVAIDPFDSNHVLYVTGATIWESHDALGVDSGQTTHWAVDAEGLEETAVLDLISPPAGAHLLSALGDIGGFRHDSLTVSPPGGMMTNPIFTTTTSIDFAEQAPSIMARVGSANSPAKRGAYSRDGGTTWTPFGSEPSGSNGSGYIAVSADGATLVWSPDHAAVSYSRDSGASWSASTGAPAGVKVIADRVNAGKFYFFNQNAGQVYVSTDGGMTFRAGAAGLPNAAGNLRAVPGREGDVWLASNAGLYHSTDSGATFSRLSSVQEAYAAGFGKAHPRGTYPAIFAAAKINNVQALFRSDDAGATWERINDDQHQYGIISPIIGDPRIYGRVYLGTNGRGIIYGDIQTVSPAGRRR